MATKKKTAETPKDDDRCENCGACKHCGGGGVRFIPYPAYYPYTPDYTYIQPTWVNAPYRVTCGNITVSASDTTWQSNTGYAA